MKKIFSILAIMIVASTTMFAADNNKIVDKKIEVTNFERLVNKGSTRVEYRQGDVTSVTVHGLAQNVDKIIVEQTGKTLTISQKGAINNYVGFSGLLKAIKEGAENGVIVVYVTSPDLTAVTLDGSGDIAAKGKVDTDKLEITLKGSGDIDFDDIICDQMNASLMGSGDIEIDRLESITSDIKLRGSGDVKVRQHNVRRTDLEIIGSGDISVNGTKCGEVKASVIGSGDITLSGEFKNIEKNIKGSGDINVR